MLAVIVPGRGRPEKRTVRGAEVLYCPVPEGRDAFAAWRRRRRFRALGKTGVRRCIVPEPWRGEAARQGLRSVEARPLRQAVLSDVLAGRRGSLARIRAPRPTRAAEAAALVLAERFRYLRLDIPRCDSLERTLLRRCGVSGGGVGEPELTVSFGGPPESDGELCMGEDCCLWQEAEYEPVEGLEGLPTSESLLCALWSGGYIKKEEIQLKSLSSRA